MLPSEAPQCFYLGRMGEWWFWHAARHKKEAKLHIIMFNTTFNEPFLSSEIAKCSFFLSSGFEVFSFHVPVDSLSFSLSFSGWQGWNGFLGKGSFRHTSFHPNRRPRSFWKHNYPPSVHVCAQFFQFQASNECVAILEWASVFSEAVCVLLGVFSAAQTETRVVFFIITVIVKLKQASSSGTPLYSSAHVVLLTPLMIVPRFPDKIKGHTNLSLFSRDRK